MKKIMMGLSVALVLVLLASCLSTGKGKTETENIEVKVLGDHLVELPLVTEINWENLEKKSREQLSSGGCSAVLKSMDNGDTVIGRSMDLGYSHNPAYVIYTDTENCYRTVSFSYNPFFGKSFEDVKENGLTQDEEETVLLGVCDTMNETGFYIEVNMRTAQPDWTGIARSTGTNPDGEISLSYPLIPLYIGQRCATVAEAVELIKKINVYAMTIGDLAWEGSFMIADALGNYGILELVDNKIVWNEGASCHANFYINPEYKDKAVFGDGFGRYKVLSEGVGNVKSEEDMADLIRCVRYSQVLDPDTCLFDPRGECTGDKGDGKIITMEMVQDETLKDDIMNYLRENGKRQKAMTIDELRDESTTWVSAWQLVANCMNHTIDVIFFEDDALSFHFEI